MLFTRQISEANARAQAADGQFNSLRAALEEGGLFTLSAGEGGKFAFALTDAGKTHFAAGATELQAQLTDANASVASLLAEKTDLTGKLAKAGTDLTAAAGERDAFKGALGADGHFTFGDDPAKPTVALTEKGKTSLINAGITAHLAAAGHAPLPVAVDKSATGNATAVQNDPAARTAANWNKPLKGYEA